MTMTQHEIAEIEVPRRRARRRMAWVSLGMICFITLASFITLLLSPERAAITSALSGASSILTMLLGVLATIIVSYFGASSAETIFKKKE